MANTADKFTMADGTDVTIVDSRIGDLTSTGITGATVAAQLSALNQRKLTTNTKWGIAPEAISLQLNPPTGKYARLFIRNGSYWYHFDIENRANN
jgi:hypothetical protein